MSEDRELIVSVKQKHGCLKGTITTTKQTIKYRFDNSRACCNEYEVIESIPLENLIGQELLGMDLKETDERLLLPTKKSNSCGGQGVFTIRCSNDVYELQMSNYHNGYYTMNFDVFVDGVCKWNLAF